MERRGGPNPIHLLVAGLALASGTASLARALAPADQVVRATGGDLLRLAERNETVLRIRDVIEASFPSIKTKVARLVDGSAAVDTGGERTRISEDFRTAWESFDFVATPTSPSVAFELGAKLEDPLAMYLNDVCAVPMSLAGIPAISIPNGLSDGLPVGFQIAGPAFSESRILDAAHALEQAIGFDGSAGRS